MRVDSLVRLRSMFRSWRSQKKSVREPVPDDLMERARRAAVVHGVGVVIRATGIQHRHLTEKVGSKKRETVTRKPRQARAGSARGGKRAKASIAAPSYSRIESPVAATPMRPLAEAETPWGVKIRVFAITPETLGLLSTLSGSGRAL